MSQSKKEARIIRISFLQSLITHRCITEKYAKQLYKRICNALRIQPSDDDFPQMLDALATSLNPLALEVRRTIDQYRGVPVLALVNTKADDIAKVATSYKDVEVAYIKKLIKEIFTAPDEAFSVSSMQALRLSNDVKPPLAKKNCEDLLDNLVAHQWLVKTESSRYVLSSRSLLELQTYLKNQFPNHLLECAKCHDIVTHGKACATRTCRVRIHVHCENRLTLRGGVAECPECKTAWNEAHPVGEDSVGSGRRPHPSSDNEGSNEEDDDELDHSPVDGTDQEPHHSLRSRHPHRRGSDDDDEEEDDDEDDDGGPSFSAARRSSRKSAAAARRKPKAEFDDEDDDLEYVDP